LVIQQYYNKDILKNILMKKKYVKPTTKVVGIDTEKSLLLGISGTTTPEKTEAKPFEFGEDDEESYDQFSESWDAWD